MRAARLISLVLLLQVREHMTAADLAEELDVSERTISRDVLALAEAGVPVYAERGRAGGYRLLGGYRSRLTGLHRAEAEAAFLAGVPGPAEQMGLGSAVTAARLKVSAALAPMFQDAPERVDQRFHLDAPGWFREPTAPPLLPELARAVWRDRRIRARYLGKNGEVERDLAPYGVVLKAGVWYLVAQHRSAVLSYRADRFTEVELLDEQVVRDEDFDLAEFWRRHREEFARSLLTERAEVRLSPAGARRLPLVADRIAAEEALAAPGPPDRDGWISVVMPIESSAVAYEQLLALGPEVEVLAPTELRVWLAGAAHRGAALYSV